MLGKKSKELREKLAKRFINSLMEKPLSWQQDWISEGSPQNGVTGRRYRALNAMWLQFVMEEEGYKDPRFFTFKQASDKGYKIKAGSKGYKVEFFSYYDKEKKEKLSYSKMLQRKKEYSLLYPEQEFPIILITQVTTVFNAEQVEGVPKFKNIKTIKGAETNRLLSLMAKGMDVEILHDGKDRAFYRLSEDKIHLPKLENFRNQEAYNMTLLHEMGHATGADKRLNRQITNSFGSEKYAKEELVAEITSCFMMSELGFRVEDTDGEHQKNHIAYVQSWAEGIKEKPEILFQAIKDASQAADYLLTIRDKVIEINAGDKNKEYVQRFLLDYVTLDYDENNLKVITGKEIPSILLAEKLKQGGMYLDEDKCKAFIEQDGEAAYNTEFYIKEKYPEINITKENNPCRFSILMMERELYKTICSSEYLNKNWNERIIFDKNVITEVLSSAGVKIEDIENKKKEVEEAKKNINEYLERTFGEPIDFTEINIEEIPLNYTNTPDELYEIQVNANLRECTISKFVEDILVQVDEYDSLHEMNEYALSSLEADDLHYISDEEYKRFQKSYSAKENVTPNFDMEIE